MTEFKPILTISFANIHDNDRLTEFRISQFKSAKEFELLDTKLLTKQRGNIFLVEKENEIISSMQIEKSETKKNLISISNVNIPEQFNFFPTFYLSKGATLKEYRNTGLNSYLRLLTIKEALHDDKIKSLTGFAYENAPRLNLLKNIGYLFYPVSFIDTSYTKPFGQLFFLSLERACFAKALKQLDEEIKELQNQFTLQIKVSK